jgi:predicted RNA binding protein YcfA (HicA-like mRNA interferase family)
VVSDRLPRITGAELARALERAGWALVRVTGSHHHYTHAARPGVLVTVPIHAGRVLPLGTLRGIMRDAGLTSQQLCDSL